MSAAVRWVPYGRPATEALRAHIALAKGDDPLRPVTVIVPSNTVGVSTRRLLASGELGPVCEGRVGMAAVGFLTVYRLAELLGAARLAASGRRPVSTAVIAAALRRVLAEEPGLFAPVASHPATEEALVRAYRELRDLPDPSLDAVATVSGRAGEVVRVCRAAREGLRQDWSDEEDLMEAAGAVIADDPSVLEPLGPVVLFLPQHVSLHAGDLLRTVAATGTVTILAGTTGDERADGEVRAAVGRLTDGPSPPPAAPPTVVDVTRTRIVTTSDADEEVRHAVRAVVDAARDGVPLARTAVLYPSAKPYARLTHEQFAAAGIARNGAAVTSLADRTAGRVLLRLLDWPLGGYRRWDLFAWLSASPVRHGPRPVPATSWERLSRRAAVVAGRADWDGRLTRLADELDTEAVTSEQDEEQPPGRPERLRRDATRSRELRTFALGLIDELERVTAGPRPWDEHATWARALLDRLVGDADQRRHWARDETAAAERIEAALARLGALSGVEGPVTLDVFRRTLQLVLDADPGRVGRLGDGVLLAPLSTGVGLDLDLVVVLGLAEGTCPAPVGEDPLLGDAERGASDGALPSRRARVDRQYRQLLAALAGSRRQVLTVPRGDLRRNAERVPSRWALDLASELAGAAVSGPELLAGAAPWAEHVSSFDAGLRAATPATDQEHRLVGLLAGVPTDPDPVLAAGLDVRVARAGAGFTRFDGRLPPGAVPSPTLAPTSTSRLELWATCPFAHLVRHVLRVEPVDEPEERLRLTPLERGNLIHEALDRFVTDAIGPAGEHLREPGTGWTGEDRDRFAAIVDAVCNEWEARGLTGRPLYWQQDRRDIRADMRRLLDMDDDRLRAAGTRAVRSEVGFGLPGADVDAVSLALPDGRAVRVRGRVDRVDETSDGRITVTDYKTGKALAATAFDVDPVLAGRKLQLPVYGLAARAALGRPAAPVTAEYWYATRKGTFRRVGYPVTAEVLDHAGKTLGTMVTSIEDGVFPNHPDAASTTAYIACEYCDPDHLGTVDLRRAFLRKASDPALARYVALAEPDLASGDDAG